VPESEKFISRKPQSAILRKHIAYYYFHESVEEGFVKKFIYYPNYKLALTNYIGSQMQFSPSQSKISPNKDSGFLQFYGGVQTNCVLAEIHAPFKKLGVVFQALGINYFIAEPLIKLQLKFNDKFEHFLPTMEDCLIKVYQTDNIDQKVELLDAYFLSRFVEMEDPRLAKAIKLLRETEEKFTVNSLAETMGVSRRTLLRIFQQHLNCSVKDYINIVQFRKALDRYQRNETKPSLTNLAYELDYYDQSEFIHHQFFATIGQQGQEDTFWTFVK